MQMPGALTNHQVAGHLAMLCGDAQFTCSALTGHARTNAGVIERFLPVRFTLVQKSTACRVHLASTAVR